MTELSVVRWTKFGRDRLYVNGTDRRQVGWFDLGTGDTFVTDESQRERVEVVLAEYVASHPELSVGTESDTRAGPEPNPETAVPPRDPGSTIEYFAPRIERLRHDLAENQPGSAPRARASALREEAPVKTLLARVLGVHTDERAWRIGADGERQVAASLDRLPAPWRTLHSIAVGSRRSDIDHVVIGPGGVFTINAKNRPRGRVWVRDDGVWVNGQRTNYVRNSRHEAQRAARLLTAACAFPVTVIGVVAIYGAESILIKSQPAAGAVYVNARRAAVNWLTARPAVLALEQIQQIYDRARDSTTWS